MVGIRHRACSIALLLVFASWLGSGCSTNRWVELRPTPRNPLADTLSLLSRGGPKPTPRTVQLLRRYNLHDRLEGDRVGLLASLDEINRREPNREILYAMAELAYTGGRQAAGTDKGRALELFGSAVMNAHEYLFADAYPVARNPYDPQFRGACDLYNAALEDTLRLVRQRDSLRPGTSLLVKTANKECVVDIVLKSNGWHEEDFDQFEFVSDYQINGLRNHYHTYGLGVPLIAIRKHHSDHDPREAFYPPRLCFPLTAFLTITPPVAAGTDIGQVSHSAAPPANSATRMRAVLELHDPLPGTHINVANTRVPLETDLSTPLAYFLNQPEFSEERIATFGLLLPEKAQTLTGLYMLEPYRPDKIPVVMVHGLWSSPVTWMEMFNDLRNDRRIRDRYQFWFYLYPTGRPFWYAAAQLREDLAMMRRSLDPQHQAPALDQMVLVGHSMGGLVSRLQTVESGNEFWQTVSDKSFVDLRADAETRESLVRTFFFRPNPSIRRVVTIGTPHRGSSFANDTTRWLGNKLISMPAMLLRGRQQLVADNPEYFRNNTPLDITTSIDSLSPESVILPVLLEADAGPWVKYHTIVGRVPDDSLVGKVTRKIGSDGDGVVSVASARLDAATSELVVPADHSNVHRHPQSVLEVRRILLEQLNELMGPTPHSQGVRFAGRKAPPRTADRLPGLFGESGPTAGAMTLPPPQQPVVPVGSAPW